MASVGYHLVVDRGDFNKSIKQSIHKKGWMFYTISTGVSRYTWKMCRDLSSVINRKRRLLIPNRKKRTISRRIYEKGITDNIWWIKSGAWKNSKKNGSGYIKKFRGTLQLNRGEKVNRCPVFIRNPVEWRVKVIWIIWLFHVCQKIF